MRRKIRTARPLFPEKGKLLKNISSILESGRLLNGEYTASLEEKCRSFLKARYAVSLNSCTTALEVVLRYIGVSGAEVIVPTNTFIATPNAVIFAGGKPVLADIKKDSYYIDPNEVRRLISKKTKAVIVVHIAGLIRPEIEEIRAICDKARIFLIEDCAHAMGGSYKGASAGSFGLAGCFSFYPTKIMTTGTGGLLVTADADLVSYAKSLRLHGAGKGLSEIVNIGNDWFMDEIRGAIGLNQIAHLKSFLKKRAAIAGFYNSLIAKTDMIQKFATPVSSLHAYYKYPVQVTPDIDIQALKDNFKAKYGFELESLYWPPCHRQPIYRSIFKFNKEVFPVTESILSRQITLPIHAAMTREDARYAFNCLILEIKKEMRTS